MFEFPGALAQNIVQHPDPQTSNPKPSSQIPKETHLLHTQGHQDEVANMGSSLASYFMVFHGLLSNRLQTAVDLCRTAHSADRGGSSAGPSASSGHGQQQGPASSNAAQVQALRVSARSLQTAVQVASTPTCMHRWVWGWSVHKGSCMSCGSLKLGISHTTGRDVFRLHYHVKYS